MHAKWSGPESSIRRGMIKRVNEETANKHLRNQRFFVRKKIRCNDWCRFIRHLFHRIFFFFRGKGPTLKVNYIRICWILGAPSEIMKSQTNAKRSGHVSQQIQCLRRLLDSGLGCFVRRRTSGGATAYTIPWRDVGRCGCTFRQGYMKLTEPHMKGIIVEIWRGFARGKNRKITDELIELPF